MTTFMRFLLPPLVRRQAGLDDYYPPFIVGMWTPVQGGDGGLNKRTYDENLGILCAIDPPLDMQVGDLFKVYWEGILVGEKEVKTPGEVDKRVLLYLDKSPVKDGWVERIYYRLFRNGSSTGEDSRALRLLVKLKLPAGIDREPHLPWHSELKMPVLPQGVIDDGVTAEWAARGIPLKIEPYPERTVRDTILLRWGSVMIAHSVTAEEAAGTAPLTLWVTQSDILAAGDNDALTIRFQVQDEVGNLSSNWSKDVNVRVEAGAWRLRAPVILDAINGVIDLDLLGTADLRIFIALEAGADFEHDDTITMTWQGIPASGKPFLNVQSFVITNLPHAQELRIPNSQIKAIGGGTGEASYVLTKANGQPPLSSKRASARVAGQSTYLPAPDVRERIGDSLDAQLPSVLVLLSPYPGQTGGDLIHVVWAGKTANGAPYIHEFMHTVTENEVGTVIGRAVAKNHIEALKNGTLDLFYEVFNDNFTLFGKTRSLSRLLNVGLIQATLPKPSVLEAVGGELDPDNVLRYATLQIDYTGTVTGDTVTYYWQGGPGDGSDSDSVPITHYSAGKPIAFSIPRKHIEPNIGGTVNVRYVLQDGRTGFYRYSDLLVLSIGSKLGDLPKPRVVQAANDVLDPTSVEMGGATLRVAYLGMRTEDRIGFSIDGRSDFATLNGKDEGVVDFTWSADLIRTHLLGKNSVTVTYTVTRRGVPKVSETLTLYISGFSESIRWTAPTYTAAVAGVLNVGGLTADAELLQQPWYYQAIGQKLWLTLKGVDQNGTALTYSHPVWNGIAITQLGVQRTTVSLDWLRKLKDGSALLSALEVSFDGVTRIPFPVSTLTVKADFWQDSITDFNNGTAGKWVLGPASANIFIRNGYYDNITISADNSGILMQQTFELQAGRTYQFSYDILNYSPLVNNIAPIISVNGNTRGVIIPRYEPARDRRWYTQSATFTATRTGPETINLYNHQPKGRDEGSEGGNDFYLDNIILKRLS